MQPRAYNLLWTLLFAATLTQAQTVPSVHAAMDAYRNALAAAESGWSPGGVESTFTAIHDLADVLLAEHSDGGSSVLESLPETEFALLQQLPGVLIMRVEILVVRPDPEFFLTLAAQAGDQADRRFAEALAATYDGYWPVYIRRQTDYSGCTTFGEDRLLDTYLAWSALERDFPDRYATAVERERDAVASEITDSTCACGDAVSVFAELERIASALTPADPVLAGVNDRLATLYERRSDIRFACRSGATAAPHRVANRRDRAAHEIVRLPPDAFASLSPRVVADLKEAGCTFPQPWHILEPTEATVFHVRKHEEQYGYLTNLAPELLQNDRGPILYLAGRGLGSGRSQYRNDEYWLWRSGTWLPLDVHGWYIDFRDRMPDGFIHWGLVYLATALSTMTYVDAIHRDEDAMCCPSGGTIRIHFEWDDLELRVAGFEHDPSVQFQFTD